MPAIEIMVLDPDLVSRVTEAMIAITCASPNFGECHCGILTPAVKCLSPRKLRVFPVDNERALL